MKRNLRSLLMTAMFLVGMTAFTSCSEETEKKCNFRIEVEHSWGFSGDVEAGMNYMSSVCDAYEAAIGMTSDDGVSFDGPLSDYSSAMVSKFNAVNPTVTAPTPSECTFQFTVQLAGYDYGSNSQRKVLASRTFTNE